EPSQYPQIPAYIGTVVAITLLGWGIGGIVGGVVADYIGRERTMIVAILAYSITSGLTAISFDWVSFAILRFLVGIAIGSEWATGSSMMAELWPAHARGRGAGLMQCGIGIGNFVASFVWLYVSALGPDSWRYLFLIGILPALLTLWIRTAIPDSNRGPGIEQVGRRQRAAQGGARTPAQRKGVGGGGARAPPLHRRGFVRQCGDPPPHHHRVLAVADDHARLVGHLVMAAALCRLA